MDRKQEEIVAKKIESGEYFSEAMSWFHAKFTRPRTEASYFFIIALIAVAAFGVGVAAISRIFPLAPGYNFVIASPITPENKIKITSIEKTGKSVNDSVMTYFLTEYVKAREEYLEKQLNRNYNIVVAMSESALAAEYDNLVSYDNKNNPIVLYGNQATREIQVNSVQFARGKKDSIPAQATVYFTGILTFVNDNTREITQHAADITFQYEQIIVDQETGKVTQNPKMLITGYKTRTLEN